MSDDKHYVPGSYFRICDESGFKIRAEKTRKMWTNTIRRYQSWEPRQPQDFVKGVRDDQTVPEPRPRQVDAFQGPLGTTLTANVLPSNSAPFFIFVGSTIRMFIDDVVQIMMDNGEIFRVRVVDVPNPTSLQIAQSLPYFASNGNIVINVTAESDPIITYPGET